MKKENKVMFGSRKIFGLVLVGASIITWRVFFERKLEIAAEKEMVAYCISKNLPVKYSGTGREFGILRSSYDFTVTRERTHLVRIYVNLFFQSERHTLVE